MCKTHLLIVFFALSLVSCQIHLSITCFSSYYDSTNSFSTVNLSTSISLTYSFFFCVSIFSSLTIFPSLLLFIVRAYLHFHCLSLFLFLSLLKFKELARATGGTSMCKFPLRLWLSKVRIFKS